MIYFHLKGLYKNCQKLSSTESIIFTNESELCVKMFSIVNNKLFSEWLLQEMNKANLSQADLARITGLSTGAISNLINQVRSPSPEALNKIAKALKLAPENVFRIAGLLPQELEKDYLTEEAEFLLSQLTELQRKQAVKFIRFLAEEKGEYSASDTMAEDG